ncbi:hypothetical protein MIND_00646000 [Mycena indigotica]|uniref:Uncharacterized protein n=1 Tax=Mycena indigotica TaxID=2126181 RepID=A0A8H6W754_9AGAR|nr:uncharacterized protein MIND_00646000 [Mycena indigotica]KAF7304143.1 hypothetical protein MIND_00646000 [Mycena indigotica]
MLGRKRSPSPPKTRSSKPKPKPAKASKPNHAPSAWSTVSSASVGTPRNSFTETDYYRKTKEEIHSPVSWAAYRGEIMEIHSTAYTYAADDEEQQDRRRSKAHVLGSEEPEADDEQAKAQVRRTSALRLVIETLFRRRKSRRASATDKAQR